MVIFFYYWLALWDIALYRHFCSNSWPHMDPWLCFLPSVSIKPNFLGWAQKNSSGQRFSIDHCYVFWWVLILWRLESSLILLGEFNYTFKVILQSLSSLANTLSNRILKLLNPTYSQKGSSFKKLKSSCPCQLILQGYAAHSQWTVPFLCSLLVLRVSLHSNVCYVVFTA